MIVIDHERPEDVETVRRVNELAFGQSVEALLVDALRDRRALLLSMVARKDVTLVGHILFTPLRAESGEPLPAGAALGPMAVLPDHQRQGIGSRLVRRGLELLREAGTRFVVVLGHPEYYPRFGFVPAAGFGMSCEFEVPPGVFMALELERGALGGWRGGVRYQPEFSAC